MRKQIVFFLFCIMGLIGCRTQDTILDENAYTIYYLNTKANTFSTYVYTASHTRTQTEALVEELMQAFLNVPSDLDAIRALPDKVTYDRYVWEMPILYLYFDTNYQSMDTTREILARAALAKTLTQIEGIEYISILSGEQNLQDASGNPVGLIVASDFLDSISNVNTFEKVDLTLYFSDVSGQYLVEEEREVFYDINTSIERKIVTELMAGPQSAGLKSTISSDAKLISVSVSDRTCYVNFDSGFLIPLGDVADYITVYSIVNSLSESANINRVQILVNGSLDVSYSTFSLSSSLERNLDYLLEE